MSYRLEEILSSLGGQSRINFGLDRMKGALAELGHPERSVHSLVIGGTNGKGTTALLVSSALREAGFRVGTYLSPHLAHPRERFLADLAPAAPEVLEALLEPCEPLARKFDLTYFEFLTLMFLLWAAREKFDFMVLEVGLGGRLDATNVTDPLACAITTIGRDHERFLGTTPESILREKLGIVPPDGLLFTGVRDPELKRQIEAHCEALDAIYYYSDELRVTVLEETPEGQRVEINGYPFRLTRPGAPMRDNAALAFLMMRIVFPRLSLETLQRGFARITPPGRWETVEREPWVVLSGDHNPQGLEETVRMVENLRDRRGRLHVVCGFSPDKPFAAMYETLKTRSDNIWLTEISSLKAALPPAYRELAPTRPPADAIRAAREGLGPHDTLLVTGSLYLLGEVRPLWRKEVVPAVEPPEVAGPCAQ